MRKLFRFTAASALLLIVTGCGGGGGGVPANSCVINVPGCVDPSFPFSCPAAANCYASVEACANSGECPP